MMKMLSAISVFFALIFAGVAYFALILVPIVLLTMWEDWVGLLAIFLWMPLVVWSTYMAISYYEYEESV